MIRMVSVIVALNGKMSSSFALSGGVGFCNAIRRILLTDLEMWAPKELTIHSNTSCQTDEYIAHRVGMIPFEKTGEGDTITLSSIGPGMVTSKQFNGHAFTPIHDTIEIMQLDTNQQLKFTVHFDKQKASTHARYSPCSAVTMSAMDDKTERHKISFESITSDTPKSLILSALDHFEARIDRALLQLANQPKVPPKSMC